jgi:murein DD-endopeptidase MepM/ murein hydrolase activator NlpD
VTATLLLRRWAGAALTLFAMASCGDSDATPGLGGEVHPASPAPTRKVASSPARSDQFVLAGELTQGGWIRGTAPAGTVQVQLDGASLPLAGDGQFLAAFDRDAGPAATLVARLADGRSVTRALAISPRPWEIERLPIGPRPGNVPSEEFLRRRAGELARINAARAIDAQSDGWRQHFVWPVRGRVSGMFGSQRIYNGTPGSYHSGTDIATGESGTPFVAPADGVVILAAESPFTLEGNLLMIDHGMGLNSAFLHCSALLVKEGDVVRQGQVIGRIGMTGRATGPHLHWSIKWRNARLDPILFAGQMH